MTMDLFMDLFVCYWAGVIDPTNDYREQEGQPEHRVIFGGVVGVLLKKTSDLAVF